MTIFTEFIGLLYQQTNDGDLVYCRAIRHEAALLGTAAASNGWESRSKQDPGKELAGDGEKGNASMVAAD
ncbi:uncharacterized [Tachysurus ichikawai]